MHKDLRSNNIFIKEKEKIVKITDFGMFNIKRLSYPKRLLVVAHSADFSCTIAFKTKK